MFQLDALIYFNVGKHHGPQLQVISPIEFLKGSHKTQEKSLSKKATKVNLNEVIELFYLTTNLTVLLALKQYIFDKPLGMI